MLRTVLICARYIMNYLDRNNIASARLAGRPGMQGELNLSSVQWNVS